MSDIIKQQRYEIFKKAEVKRRAERLTKKELCNLYGINYNFYMNCLNKTSLPSEVLVKHLQDYLVIPTEEVYHKVMGLRAYEEKFHHRLDITDEEVKLFEESMKNEGVLNEPK